MAKLYREYFNIDPKYYAAVTADLIAQGKVSWKGFLPHETFVKLLEVTHRALSGLDPRSIWVEGPYGTGKSHAALTVKSILDATDEEVIDYFDDFGLSHDLRDKYVALKNSGRILTVHRVGSAGIDTDLDLVMAVQQSIIAALKANGIENQGDASMKDAFLEWMKVSANKNYFGELIKQEKYMWTFSGATPDAVIDRLNTASPDVVEATMRSVMTVLKDAGQYGLFKDVNSMVDWIKSIIDENHLAAILFVWDEFSEYLLSHPVSLTGFQTLVEISASKPFYFMLVTHESKGLFADTATAKKVFNRFVGDAAVRIELPENIAFDLMHQAMKTTNDPVLAPQWEKDKNDLNDELVSVRNEIIASSKKQATLGQKTVISDKQLREIVPMHPYAALILKQIAVLFTSNQRSMFDFIISNDMTDARAFKWYINNFGPEDEQNLLTVDLLWDFFYGKGRNGLNDDVRGVLESYQSLQADKLLPDEQRVLRTVLLLQAISLRISGNELLTPSASNLELAFAGTDWSKGKALAIANGLIEKGILFEKPVGSGKKEYCVAGGGPRTINLPKLIEEVLAQTKTQGLITGSAPMLDQQGVYLPKSFEKRYIVEATSYGSFTNAVQKMKSTQVSDRFKLIVTFAKDDAEQQQLHQQIIKTINMPGNDIMFAESQTPMGKDLLDQYANNMALAKHNAGKDDQQAGHYSKQAAKTVEEWLQLQYGNPSTLYSLAREPRKALLLAREKIAAAIGASPEEIFFTSGGTESDNWAIKGAAFQHDPGANIITSVIEHHAVLNSCRSLERMGYQIIRLPVDGKGIVSPDSVDGSITDKTVLVSVMLANNEIGTIEPIHALTQATHRHGILFHTDAVQAIGHIPVHVRDLGVDMLSASAHKFNGPKGIGFLYVRSGTELIPLIDGGGQEHGMRAGTENVAGIVGMAAALQEHIDHMDKQSDYLNQLSNDFLHDLNATGLNYIVNGDTNRIPGSLSLSFLHADGEMLLHRLDLMGTAIATGSACNSKEPELSHVIRAIGTPAEYAKGTIRITFGMDNNSEQAKTLALQIASVLS
ncbi:MAG: cysteine desulfurase [Clostridia bacterium]|nr:cysteine desulfurase [Clostridia bacterium]